MNYLKTALYFVLLTVTEICAKMWKAQAGVKVAAPQTGGDDDDWETDADFVVGYTFCPCGYTTYFML